MNQQHLSHPKYRADIDGLRAIAILSVIGFHAFPDWVRGGFVGVDIFFVISGYLISTIIFGNLERDSFSYAEFYARRVKRIFPALILVLVSCLVIGWQVMDAVEFRQLGKHAASGAGFVSNFSFWLESGYFDSDAKTKPLLHLWSLGIEEQFYIIWPLLLGLVWKRKWNFLTLTLLIAVASFAVNIFSVSENQVSAFYSPLSRFWELMTGGILAYITLHKPHYISHRKPAIRNWQSVVGLTLITLGVVSVTANSRFPGWWALLPATGAFLVISAGSGAWFNRHVLGSRQLVWVGLISYPLYLWHWPLLSFARIIEGHAPSNEIRIAAVFASFVLAWLTYRLIEKPIRSRGEGPARGMTIALCVAMTVVGLIGYNIYDRNGLGFRNANRTSNSAMYDWTTGYRLNQCFLAAVDSLSGPSAFADYCSGVTKAAIRKPLVMIWGDSHAASLYRGLYSQKDASGFDLAQYNAGGCPPIVGFAEDNRAKCKDINQYVMEKIKMLRPDTVILAANWAMYNGRDKWNLLDFDKLKSTVQMLRSLGVPNIVLVGQLPCFESRQPKVGAQVFVANKVDRTYRHFNSESLQANRKIKAFAEENRVEFVSPIDLLCNADGCLISTSRTKLMPLAWDYCHLTEAGSTLLIDSAVKSGMLHLPHR